MSAVLRVLDPGPLTTVQDGGRPGYAHLGVPRSGALDGPAAALANRLVGNAADAAVLETTLGGVRFSVSMATTVAVTGAVCTLTVGGREEPWGAAVSVPAGVPVTAGPALWGVRSYVAVAGGVLVAPVLGSRSTDTLSGLGPPPLAAGLELPVGSGGRLPPSADVVVPRPRSDETVLSVHPGPRLDRLGPAAWDRLTTSAYRVAADSNRIALRLAGPPLPRPVASPTEEPPGEEPPGEEPPGEARPGVERPGVERPGAEPPTEEPPGAELSSEGIVLGAVQVPHSGQPLVFLADHPTTGGYPVVAVVDPADLPSCAQLRPGDPVRLRPARPNANAR